MRHFSSNVTDRCPDGSPNLFIPYREQPRSIRIVVAHPRLALSAIKRAITVRLGLINKSTFVKATRHAEIKGTEISRSIGVEVLSR